MSEEKIGDNGKDEGKVTPGAMTPEDKKKAFEANPDEFINIADLIVATARTPQGVAIMINPSSAKEYHLSRSMIDYTVNQQLMFMEAQKFKENQKSKNIITNLQNKGNFRNFIKGKH